MVWFNPAFQNDSYNIFGAWSMDALSLELGLKKSCLFPVTLP